MTRRQLEEEHARLKRVDASLGKILRTVEGLGLYSADTLERLVQSFADDPDTQIRVAEAVAEIADAWARVAAEMGRALTATKY